MANKVELQFLSNAKQLLGELRSVNAYLHNIQDNLDRMNTKAVAGHREHSSSLKGLALRFVGYNLILNQVMNAQRKLYDYVTEGVSKFREFQTRIAEVSTIMGDDFQTALTGMQAGIVSLSLTYGQSTSDLSKGLYDIMSAAFSAKDAMVLLNQATKASIAGLSDVRTSVDIFTTVLNSYGMTVYEATKVSDTLFQSVVRGKFQFEELESALGYVVPIAAQAGIAFEELMAALSTTTRHGLHLDMAARGLALALQNIINPSEGAAKAAEKYGVEISGLALRIKGISGVFKDLKDATQEYGKIVLNEIIPNMRSLRVAMVLAGEEGFAGLLDDMDRLSVSAGRTEQALNKIMNTSQFVSNQIQQQWEKTQREVGQAWDKFALSLQKGITNIAPILLDWKTYVPFLNIANAIGKGLENVSRQHDKLARVEKYTGFRALSPIEQMIPKYAGAQWIKTREFTDTGRLKVFLELQQDINNAAERYNRALAMGAENAADIEAEITDLVEISAMLQDDFNRLFGEPILGGIRNLEELKLTLEEIEVDTERLREELEKPIKYGWAAGGMPAGVIYGTLNMQRAQLKAEQDLKDVQYDVKMGLEDSSYAYKVLNADMQEAIRIVREHTEATEKDRIATQLMSAEMRKLQIAMLELQLVGMMRRRGLTRSEERQMKRLQIAQAKLRLQNMKETHQETAVDVSLYEEKKKMIDDYIRAKEHETYMLKYNYDQQIEDIDATIAYEQKILSERETQWSTTATKITTLASTLVSDLKVILRDPDLVKAFEDFGIDISDLYTQAQTALTTTTGKLEGKTPAPEAVKSAYDLLSQFGAGKIKHPGLDILESMAETQRWYFQRGTEYVPETGLAMVHRGETIGAAGKELSRGDIVIESVTIAIKSITDIDSVEKFGAMLSSASNAQILNKQGKTNYRLRIG